MLDIVLDVVAYLRALDRRWQRAAMALSLAYLCLSSVLLTVLSALLIPVTLAIITTALTVSPLAITGAWVLACTSPACDQLWQPMLIWATTRYVPAKSMLLSPMTEEFLEDCGAAGVRDPLLMDEGWEASARRAGDREGKVCEGFLARIVCRLVRVVDLNFTLSCMFS